MTIRTGIGIDVGGTFTKIAVIEGSGRLIREIEVPTQAARPAPEFVGRISSMLGLLETDLGQEFAAVGLGLAGDVDSERGVLRFAPSLKGWNNFNFKAAFSKRLRRPVVIDNDANVAVWGGYVMELKSRPKNVIGVTLGTGVGGGVIVDGKLYRGSTGSAGEIGHTRVESPGAPCRCGARGCLEAYAGSYGIVRSARQALRKAGGKKSLLREIASTPGRLDPLAISVAAAQGDPIAREVWDKTARYLAVGMTNLVLVFNPDVILILGGVSRAGDLLIKPIMKELKSQPFRTPFDHVSIRIAKNQNWGCVGAALLALDAAR